ncbi:WavE lipopolysaccharide synthesis [Vibrio cholerae]|nr:WavE lipopolysaccharide synthesis [Vibrio cholerae]
MKMIKVNADSIILNDDPGSVKINDFKVDNINRQLISTQNGLEEVKTSYVCKIRSDTYLNSSKIIEIYNKYNSKKNKYEHVKIREKILVTNLTTLNPEKSVHKFHVCDWIFMGLTDDIKNLFHIELKKEHFFYYYSQRKYIPDGICSKQRSESVIFSHLYSNENVGCFDSDWSSKEAKDLTFDLFKNSLIIVNPWMINLISIKHKRIYFWMNTMRFTFNDWLKLTGRKRNIRELFRENMSFLLNYLVVKAAKIKSSYV